MQSWGQVTLLNVGTGGDLTQLFPDFVAAGTGASTTGTFRRCAAPGILHRMEINPKSVGGIFELWDIAGLIEGASNNADTGTNLSNTYLATKQARKEAKLLWRIDFKGDSGLTNKIFGSRVGFSYGLAGRFIDTISVVGAESMQLNIVADGGYRVVQIAG